MRNDRGQEGARITRASMSDASLRGRSGGVGLATHAQCRYRTDCGSEIDTLPIQRQLAPDAVRLDSEIQWGEDAFSLAVEALLEGCGRAW